MQTECMNDRAIMSTKDLMTFIRVTETSKKQLDRGGSPLTKPDLIAIVLALRPSMKNTNDLNRLDQMRTTDLISVIRCMIYDPQLPKDQDQLPKNNHVQLQLE